MKSNQIEFRLPCKDDAEAIHDIHRAGLASGHASFRETPYSWADFCSAYQSDRSVALVATLIGKVVGWGGVAATSTRPTYAGVGEVSIYLAPDHQGKGIGKALFNAIIDSAEAKHYWTLFAHIFPENLASLALHKACGFEVVGRRKKLGKMAYGPLAGQWRDVVLVERRSERVGTS